MTYGELKGRLAAISHRTDLEAQLPNFIQDAGIEINRRFGLALPMFVADTDTNDVLTLWGDLYLFRSLASLYEHLNNGDNARYYLARFNDIADRQNITAGATATDAWATEPPVIVKGE